MAGSSIQQIVCRAAQLSTLAGCLLTIFTFSVHADASSRRLASANPAVAAATSEQTVATDRYWSLAAGVSIYSSLQTLDNADHVSAADFVIAPAIKLGKGYNISSMFALEKGLENEMFTTFRDPKFTFSHDPLPINKIFSFTPAASLIVAATPESVQGDSLYSIIQLQPKIGADWGYVGPGQLSTAYQLTGARYFHEFETSRLGESNSAYALTNRLIVTYTLFERFYIGVDLIGSSGFTYKGTTKNNFDFTESLSYDLSPAFNVEIGLNNSGTAFHENGVTSNIAFFDGNSSTVYAGLNFSY